MTAARRLSLISSKRHADAAGDALRECFNLLDQFDWPELLREIQASKSREQEVVQAELSARAVEVFLESLRQIKASVDDVRVKR